MTGHPEGADEPAGRSSRLGPERATKEQFMDLSKRCRTGPDSARFRDFPVFAGEVMQLESHLGHSIPPRQRGFCFNLCTLTLAGFL
jgi:hypothetical protein